MLLHVQAVAGLTVSGVEDLLLEMLANLLDNALRVTPPGGEIRMSSEPGEEGTVVLTVADTGPGIPPELAERVFELFAQVPGTRQTGAGLGLAIVAAIAKVHGGVVKLDERQSHGAVFKVTLNFPHS